MAGQPQCEWSSYWMGTSAAMEPIRVAVPELARTSTPILIVGEWGSGRQQLARYIHHLGPLASQDFVPLTLDAYPEEERGMELFGPICGMGLNPDRDCPGAFEAAAGSTLYVSGIHALPREQQLPVLRALDTGFAARLTAPGEQYRADVRLIAAAPPEHVRHNRVEGLCDGLSERIGATTIHLPPLRERIEDVPGLATALVLILNGSAKRRVRYIDPDVMPLLAGYAWPGNERQLGYVILRLLACAYRAKSETIRMNEIETLAAADSSEATGRAPTEPSPESFRDYLRRRL